MTNHNNAPSNEEIRASAELIAKFYNGDITPAEFEAMTNPNDPNSTPLVTDERPIPKPDNVHPGSHKDETGSGSDGIASDHHIYNVDILQSGREPLVRRGKWPESEPQGRRPAGRRMLARIAVADSRGEEPNLKA